jgi:hypothetical protein
MIGIGSVDLSDLIRAAASANRKGGDDEQPPIVEAQITELRTLAEVYWRSMNHATVSDMANIGTRFPGFPFRLGDLVTPRVGAPLRDAGKPHIVVEVNPSAQPHFAGDEGGWHAASFGERLTIRVMCWNGGRYVCFWNPAWMHEKFAIPTT